MRIQKKAAIGSLGAAAALALSLALSSSAAQGAAAISVTPASGLSSGNTVSVTLSGLTPGKTYMVGQCVDFDFPPAGPPICDTAGAKPVTGVDSATIDIKVKKTFKGGHSAAPQSVTCNSAVGGVQCVIAVVEHPAGGPPSGPLDGAKAIINFS